MKYGAGIVLMSVLAAGSLVGCATSPTESNHRAVADATISANVKAALVQDPVTRASNISVNTLDGTVELSGFVNSPGQRHEASEIVRNVAGVRSIRNELQVNGQGEVVGTAIDDDAISHRVESALGANSSTAGSQIKVSTSDGVVQLAGFVNSNQQRETAGDVASSVQGVRKVDNDLRINPGD